MTSRMLPLARAVRSAVPKFRGVGRRVSLLALLILSIPRAAVAEVVYSYTGALQTFTAPATGNYHVTVRGASGGNGYSTNLGGSGATVSGDLFLTAGDILSLIVGGSGTKKTGQFDWAGGGGGGSFVYSGSVAALVAGGGGGAGYASGGANSTTLGGTGLGGAGGGLNYGGGGAGFLGNGGTGGTSLLAYGGNDEANGFGGGVGQDGGNGGFGGGGGANFATGGGGGGYTGGNGGAETGPGQAFGGGAGTSYYNSILVSGFSLTGGSVSGNGSVSITAIPEIDPAGMGSVLTLVAGALGLVERRRLKVA